MRSIAAGLQTALNNGTVVERDLVRFEFGTGTYGFWSDIGPYTWNSLTYVGAGQLIHGRITPMQVSDGSAVSLDLRMSSIPDSEITPDVLSTIEDETYYGKPVRMYRHYFDAETRAFITSITLFVGQCYNIDHEFTIGGEMTLTMHCESRALDHVKIGYAMRSDQHQRIIDPADRFLEYASIAGTTVIYWGREPAEVEE